MTTSPADVQIVHKHKVLKHTASFLSYSLFTMTCEEELISLPKELLATQLNKKSPSSTNTINHIPWSFSSMTVSYLFSWYTCTPGLASDVQVKFPTAPEHTSIPVTLLTSIVFSGSSAMTTAFLWIFNWLISKTTVLPPCIAALHTCYVHHTSNGFEIWRKTTCNNSTGNFKCMFWKKDPFPFSIIVKLSGILLYSSYRPKFL